LRAALGTTREPARTPASASASGVSFVSTQVEKLDSRAARVTGNLTMLGVTRSIVLTVNVDADPLAKGRAVAFVATGTIRRSEFGMPFGVPLIDDTLEITVKTRALADEKE